MARIHTLYIFFWCHPFNPFTKLGLPSHVHHMLKSFCKIILPARQMLDFDDAMCYNDFVPNI